MKHPLRGGVVAALAVATAIGCSRVDDGPDARSATTGDGTAAPVSADDVLASVGPSVVHLHAPMPERSLRTEPSLVRAGPLGTGFVIGKNLVLTSVHVVDHAADVHAKLADGRDLPTSIAHADPLRDLVVLRLNGDASGLRPLPLADRKAVRSGEPVYAVGDATGRGCTISLGVLTSDLEDEVQTDAAIHHQNTGGPIVNGRGEVLALANARLTQRRGVNGIGYGTRLDSVAPLVVLLERGEGTTVAPSAPAVSEASALRGITVTDLDESTRGRFDIAETVGEGAVVTEVERTSPAGDVGIEPGDVVVEIDMVPIASAEVFGHARRAEGPLLLLVVRDTTAAYVVLNP
jgi:S1-C subfamily serine protease